MKNTLFLYPGLEEKVIRLIRTYEMEERIILSSFNHYSLVNCHQLAPELETAPLYRDGLYMPWIYAKAIGGSAIHPNIRAAPDALIQSSVSMGVPVRPYTINKEAEMKRLFKLGVQRHHNRFSRGSDTDQRRIEIKVRKKVPYHSWHLLFTFKIY